MACPPPAGLHLTGLPCAPAVAGKKEEPALLLLSSFSLPKRPLGWSRALSPARGAGKITAEGVETDNVTLSPEQPRGAGTVREAPAFDRHRNNLHQRASLLPRPTNFCTLTLFGPHLVTLCHQVCSLMPSAETRLPEANAPVFSFAGDTAPAKQDLGPPVLTAPSWLCQLEKTAACSSVFTGTGC